MTPAGIGGLLALDFSGAVLVGFGAFLAGLGSVLSGIAALKTARRRQDEKGEDEAAK